jgi:Flp pilus assembly protein TadG
MNAMDMARQRKDVSKENGAILVEAALTMLVFLMMIFAIAETGRFLQVQHTLTNAAREGARLGVTPLAASMPGVLPKDSDIQAAIKTYLGSSVISTSQVNVNVDRTAPDYTAVTITCQYQPMTGLFPFMKVNLVGSSSMRNETSP